MEEPTPLKDGIAFEIEEKVNKIHFILGLGVGNNLAVNSILGFVQTFSAKRFFSASTSKVQFKNGCK